jgi:hypothetical protein
MMRWIVAGVLAWAVLSVPVAILVGRVIRWSRTGGRL